MRRIALSCALALLSSCSDEPATEGGFVTEFETCAEARYEATFTPVNLLITIDRSDSMADGKPTSKWVAASSAISGFLASPGAGSLDVALRMWPDPDGCNTDACDAAACSDPQVEIGPLGDPAHLAEVQAALAAVAPAGQTPLSAAMDGATRWALGQLNATPDERAAVVLVTDGQANGCDENIDTIVGYSAIAATAGVSVFAVGIEGSNEAEMDRIAKAGGTGDGFFVGQGAVEKELLSALLAIQGEVLDCRLAVPGGEAIDTDLMRVELTLGGDVSVVPRVEDAAACTPEGGWYLDADGAVTLCETTCAAAQEDPEASLAVAVGCECEQDSDCGEDQICQDNACVPCEGFECAAPGGPNVQGGAGNCGTVPAEAAWILVPLAFLLLPRRRS